MSAGQLAGFRAAMAAAMSISDERGYNYLAGIHGYPLPISCGIAHGRALFLPWHRAYLYFFELALRDRRAEITIPWWDWTRTRSIPTAYGRRKLDGRAANPLFSAKVDPVALEQGVKAGDRKAAETARFPGQGGAPPLPTAQEVNAVLGLGDFNDFTHQLEQLHNNVHVWVGGDQGHMSDIPFAAFDPIFWAHHAMIDRIWRLWQVRHPRAAVPAALMNEALPPFPMTVAQTIDTTALGYDYAAQSVGTAAGG